VKMNRANMAKQITEVPMAGCKPKGMKMGGKVMAGYKKGGKVKMAKGGGPDDVQPPQANGDGDETWLSGPVFTPTFRPRESA
jgi:hypothetical protein